jgi:hypothetical protein
MWDPAKVIVKLTVPHGLRIWRKLHLAADVASNTLVAATLTTNSEGDTITRQEVPTTGPSSGGSAEGEQLSRRNRDRVPAVRSDFDLVHIAEALAGFRGALMISRITAAEFSL